MAARSPLRLLAPIAIVVVLVGVVVVVVGSFRRWLRRQGQRAHGDRSGQEGAAQAHVPGQGGRHADAISDKTGVSTGQLVALNPGLDPQALQPGDRLKLRP
jgi:hypothetical protein